MTKPQTKPAPSPDKKIELVLFFTGIVLLCLATILVFVFPQIKTIGDVRYTIVKVILALSTAMVVSQIPGMIKINLPLGIKAAGGIAFGVMVYLLTPDAASPINNDISVDKKELGECNYPKIKFAILCSGSTDYTRSITTSFINTLQSTLPIKHKKCLSYDLHYGPRIPYDSSKKEYLAEVENILARGVQYDYYIGVGTAATLAYKDYFKSNNITNAKLIFLGVTDPVASGLVNRLTDRNQDNNSTGVAYCGNFEDLPSRIHDLYPRRKIEYIYWTAYPQDRQIADRIKNISLVQDSILIINPLNRQPNINDFIDTSLVYFSWVTMETMFESEDIETVKKINHIVSTTQTQAIQGIVPFAVTTSDIEIGREGANIVLANIGKTQNLGLVDVYVPKWHVYVNCATARAKGIRRELISLADEKFDCGD